MSFEVPQDICDIHHCPVHACPDDCPKSKAVYRAAAESRDKSEREGAVDVLRGQLLEALALLDKSKAEMSGEDLDAAWQTMEDVEDLGISIRNGSEHLRIRLRQQAEYRNKKND